MLSSYWVRIFLFVVVFPMGAVRAQAGLPAIVDGAPLPSLAPMVETVLPAVVNISTRGRVSMRENPLMQDPFFRRFFGAPETQPRERQTSSLGSGVIIDAAAGHVVTNQHVIGNADEITVRLHDGRSVQAEVIGSDPNADIAVIKIPAQDLTAIDLGNSDRLRVGDFVVAIGNPFGLGQTVTSGIVSALGRSGLGIEDYEDFIQTDASINQGNSGGALVNLRGELIGVNTAIVGPSGGNVGIGFAIPINMVLGLTRQIVEFGEVRRGRLGVVIQDLTRDLAEAFGIDTEHGAVIAQVMPDSAAADAGFKEADVITAVNGRPVKGATDLRNKIGLSRSDEEVEIQYFRNGQQATVRVKLRPAEVAIGLGEKISQHLTGATLADSEDGEFAGVRVTEVEMRSPAWDAGLRKNDLIVSINRERVKNIDDVRQVVSKHSAGVLLQIKRGDSALFLAIR
ncbi:DegQ family serine endoprotease [Gammaproteobacteria bacterium]|nr:DegQ family serine endoprotease [Gammaproteobacteria bacterium]MDG2076038.1 DegQ family serine endoprotease [Arenicellales bacterium]